MTKVLSLCELFLQGDEEEWEQQCYWHTGLKAVLNRVSVFMERLQTDRDQLSVQETQHLVSLFSSRNTHSQTEMYKSAELITSSLNS